METPLPTPTPQHVSLKLNLRIIVVLLLAIIIAMTIIWKPWVKATTSDRTVQVTGSVTLKAEPDEFNFYPSYIFENANKDTALAALTKKNDQIVAKLKTLGVLDNQIKTNASNNDSPMIYSYSPIKGLNTYTLNLTLTVGNKDLAQKVENYLVTTIPIGSLTPQADFSQSKRKQLENTARDQATKDARSKVEQMAKNLGFKIGDVKSVQDGSGFGIQPVPLGAANLSSDETKDLAPQLTIQPGQNDLSYSVTVTYFIR